MRAEHDKSNQCYKQSTNFCQNIEKNNTERNNNEKSIMTESKIRKYNDPNTLELPRKILYFRSFSTTPSHRERERDYE